MNHGPVRLWGMIIVHFNDAKGWPLVSFPGVMRNRSLILRSHCMFCSTSEHRVLGYPVLVSQTSRRESTDHDWPLLCQPLNVLRGAVSWIRGAACLSSHSVDCANIKCHSLLFVTKQGVGEYDTIALNSVILCRSSMFVLVRCLLANCYRVLSLPLSCCRSSIQIWYPSSKLQNQPWRTKLH